MKNTYSLRQFKYCTLLSTILLLVLSTNTYAQVRTTFTQRTSTLADQKYVKKGSDGKIYNLRGDFKMAGNTNLTLVNYTDNGNNSDELKYVDIDLDGTTINSSSSYLDLPNDGCTEIVYAGLYWSGRANTGAMSFNVRSNAQISTGTPTAKVLNHIHGGSDNLDNTVFKVDRGGVSGAYYPIHTVKIGTKEFEFTIKNDGTVSMRERLNYAAWSTAVSVAVSSVATTPQTTTSISNWVETVVSNNYSSGTPSAEDEGEWRGRTRSKTRTVVQTNVKEVNRTATETENRGFVVVYTLTTPITYVLNGQTYTISKLSTIVNNSRTREITENSTVTETRTITQTATQTRTLQNGRWNEGAWSTWSAEPAYTESTPAWSSTNPAWTNTNTGTWSAFGNNASVNDLRIGTNNYATIGGPQTTGRTTTPYDQTLTKNIVKFKIENGPYEDVEADVNDIRYPNGSDSDMYAAYADVTDLVQKYGGGNYFVADIATTVGNNDYIGRFGGWGLVVIYADPSMKWRDITVFDGYAYVLAGTANHELPISGFKAAQSGLVNVDIGVMAGEGDQSYSGDYFQVLGSGGTASNANHYKNLGNSTGTGGFFNSNIDTGSLKNPSLVNNTGIDIQRIALPNQTQAYTGQSSSITSNYIIGNNATSTTFRYGSTLDTYIIYNLVFAVDAYVPEAMPINMPLSIVKAADSSTITDPVEITQYMKVLQPNDILEMEMKIVNTGNERIRKAHIDIQIPKEFLLIDTPTMLIGDSAVIKALPSTIPDNIDSVTSINGIVVLDGDTTTNTVLFNDPTWTPTNSSDVTANDYEGGLISWYLGTIPTQEGSSNPFEVPALATMRYTLKVTANCEQLKYSNATCFLIPKVAGGIYGRGELSNAPMQPEFIIGLKDATCLEVEKGTLDFNIKADSKWLADNCKSDAVIKDVELVYPCNSKLDSGVFPINKRDLVIKTPSELLADGDSSTTATSLVYRYPVETRFFIKPPIDDTGTRSEIQIDTATFAGTVDVKLTLDTATGDMKGMLYAVIPIHHEVNPKGPFNCYYVVSIIIPSKSELPKVPNSAVSRCNGTLYDYDVEITEAFIGNLELRYYEQTNPEVTNADSKTWRLLPGKPYPNAVGTHNFAATQGFVEGSTVICESDKAPYVIEIKGCSIPANPQLMNKYRKP